MLALRAGTDSVTSLVTWEVSWGDWLSSGLAGCVCGVRVLCSSRPSICAFQLTVGSARLQRFSSYDRHGAARPQRIYSNLRGRKWHVTLQKEEWKTFCLYMVTCCQHRHRYQRWMEAFRGSLVHCLLIFLFYFLFISCFTFVFDWHRLHSAEFHLSVIGCYIKRIWTETILVFLGVTPFSCSPCTRESVLYLLQYKLLINSPINQFTVPTTRI